MSSSAAVATRTSPPNDDGRTAGLSPRSRRELRLHASEPSSEDLLQLKIKMKKLEKETTTKLRLKTTIEIKT